MREQFILDFCYGVGGLNNIMKFKQFYNLLESPFLGKEVYDSEQKLVFSEYEREKEEYSFVEEFENLTIKLNSYFDINSLVFLEKDVPVLIIKYKNFLDGISLIYTQQSPERIGLFRHIMENYMIPKFKSVYSDEILSSKAFDSWLKLYVSGKFDFFVYDLKSKTTKPFVEKGQIFKKNNLINVRQKN